MKRLLAIGMMAAAVCANAEMKVATVDLVRLIKHHPNHESNRTLVKSTAEDYRKKMENKQAKAKEILDEAKKIQEEWQNPLLSPAAKAGIQKKLENVQQRLLAAQQEMRADDMHYQEELTELEQRLLKIETSDMKKKLEEYAKKNGYDMIIDVAACGYSKPEMEVTDTVLKEMGIDPAADKKKAAAK